MSRARLKALDVAIREALKPELHERGFDYEASSRTFRRKVGECTQIVNVQVGVRSMEGQFTINLGVFHPSYRLGADRSPPPAKPKESDCWERKRLAALRETLLSKLFRPKASDAGNFLKWRLATSSDKWWPLTSDERENARQLLSLKELLLTRGTSWLDAKSDAASIRNAYEEVKRARAGV